MKPLDDYDPAYQRALMEAAAVIDNEVREFEIATGRTLDAIVRERIEVTAIEDEHPRFVSAIRLVVLPPPGS